jgi:predicted SAM-dependent methyltransferase
LKAREHVTEIYKKLKRVLNPIMTWLGMNIHGRRKSILTGTIKIKNRKGLEIGPLDKPLVAREDGSIKYLDYISREELIARHANTCDPAKIVPIDYVNPPQNDISRLIEEKFDYIIACQVIEHIPNLIAWLQDLHKILNEDGCLFLAIPDKRYTFDILRPTTPLSHFLNDYSRNVKSADLAHVFEHIYLKRDVIAKDVWHNKAEEKISVKLFTAEDAYNRALKEMDTGKYPDVHCHVFISQEFLQIINTLIEMELVPYTVHKFEDVKKPFNEFFLILKRNLF